MRYRYYRRGEYFPPALVIDAYFIDDFLSLGLDDPGYGRRWIRYGPDALLIDNRTGQVLDVVYGVYDDSSNVAPPPEDFSDSAANQPLRDNWNTAACGFTDTATLDVDSPMRLDRFELWVNWLSGEQSMAYRVFRDGEEIGGGQVERADCDPYQSAWCVASDSPAAELDPGRYEFRIERSAICQNDASDGWGFIRAWGVWR
jgi:hypothetical protein